MNLDIRAPARAQSRTRFVHMDFATAVSPP